MTTSEVMASWTLQYDFSHSSFKNTLPSGNDPSAQLPGIFIGLKVFRWSVQQMIQPISYAYISCFVHCQIGHTQFSVILTRWSHMRESTNRLYLTPRSNIWVLLMWATGCYDNVVYSYHYNVFALKNDYIRAVHDIYCWNPMVLFTPGHKR